jgi:NTE family protein
MSDQGKDISLILGSGGARGLAHIGAIEVLEERGYRIASIAGSSMGALVGGIHASGKLKEYRDWVVELERLDVVRLLDFTIGGNGVIKGDRIIEVLKDMIGDQKIEDLSMAYTAVATDLDRQREIWLSQGSLFDAIRASIAIPMLFTPVRLKGRTLVDGGLVNPIPVAPTLRDLTDLTVVVNVNASRPAGPPAAKSVMAAKESASAAGDIRSKIASFLHSLGISRNDDDSDDGAKDAPGIVELMSRSLDTMQHIIGRHRLAGYEPNIVVGVPRTSSFFYEFWRARELVEIGRRCATEALDGFEQAEAKAGRK